MQCSCSKVYSCHEIYDLVGPGYLLKKIVWGREPGTKTNNPSLGLRWASVESTIFRLMCRCFNCESKITSYSHEMDSVGLKLQPEYYFQFIECLKVSEIVCNPCCLYANPTQWNNLWYNTFRSWYNPQVEQAQLSELYPGTYSHSVDTWADSNCIFNLLIVYHLWRAIIDTEEASTSLKPTLNLYIYTYGNGEHVYVHQVHEELDISKRWAHQKALVALICRTIPVFTQYLRILQFLTGWIHTTAATAIISVKNNQSSQRLA